MSSTSFSFYARGLQALSISAISRQLEAWLNALPNILLVCERPAITLSHVLSLHICFWWLVPGLHLPLLDTKPKSKPESKHAIAQPPSSSSLSARSTSNTVCASFPATCSRYVCVISPCPPTDPLNYRPSTCAAVHC